MNPEQTATKSGSILTHIVCNIGRQSTYAKKRADDNCVNGGKRVNPGVPLQQDKFCAIFLDFQGK